MSHQEEWDVTQLAVYLLNIKTPKKKKKKKKVWFDGSERVNHAHLLSQGFSPLTTHSAISKSRV